MTKKYLTIPCSLEQGRISCIVIIMFVFIHFWAKASSEPFPIGARSWALGNANVSLIDPNAFFNNPASMAFLENKVLSASCHIPFGYTDLKTMSLAGIFSFGTNALGIGMMKFGDKLFNRQNIGLAYAKRNNRIALGGKISLLQENIIDERTHSTFISEFGIYTKISSKLSLGFHAHNLTRAALRPTEKIPTTLRLGLSFLPTNQILLVIEAENQISNHTQVKAGLEYQIIKNVYLRTGISTAPILAHFGFGIRKKQFLFDAALIAHSTLGTSSHFTVSYYLN